MLNTLPIDRFLFRGDTETAFLQAMEQGNMFLKQFPESKFLIVFDSSSKQIELHYDRKPLRSLYPELFGPGVVPGYLTEEDMLAIEHLVGKIPDSGNIVEVGSFLGKSSVEWAKNVIRQNKNYKIICIDSFNSPVDILQDLLTVGDFDVPSVNSHLEMFQHYTGSYKNIFSLETFFDETFQIDLNVDLVFEDSDHTQRTLNYALTFWWSKLNIGGILSGHDYNNRQVKTSVDTFALINGLTVKTFPKSSIWYIEKHA